MLDIGIFLLKFLSALGLRAWDFESVTLYCLSFLMGNNFRGRVLRVFQGHCGRVVKLIIEKV
jgi:hypothetical protein